MSKIVDVTDFLLALRRNQWLFEDGFDVGTSGSWTNTLGTSAAAAVASGFPSAYTLTTAAGTSNNNASRQCANAMWFPQTNQGLYYWSRIKLNQGNTNQASVFCGFSSTFASGLMQSGMGSVNSNFTGCGFFLQGGGTTWSIVVSNGTTQTIVQLTSLNAKNKLTAAFGDGNWHELEVRINPTSSTFAEVLFFVDKVLVYAIPEWTFTSGSAMTFGEYVQSGTTATNAEVLTVDYHAAQQDRISA